MLTLFCLAFLFAASSALNHHEPASFHQLSEHDYIPVQEFRVALLFITTILAIKVVTHMGSSSDWIVRRAFWLLMSNSVSVFLAIFTYSTADTLFKSLMHHSKFETMDPYMRGYLGRVLAALWYVAMVLCMSHFACLARKQLRERLANDASTKQVVKNKMQTCLFLSHCAAFTGIEATCRIINTATWENGDATLNDVRGVVLYSILRYAFFLVILSLSRKAILHRIIPDHHADELVEEWDEMVEEGEHDLFALMASFFIALYLIFGLEGTQIINCEGHESHKSKVYEHSYKEIGWLYFYAILFLLASYAWGIFSKTTLGLQSQNHHGHHHGHLPTGHHPNGVCVHSCRSSLHWVCSRVTSNVKKRVGPFLMALILMVFSWCYIFATRWLLAKLMHKYDMFDELEVSPMMLSVWSVYVSGILIIVVVYAVTAVSRRLDRQRVMMREVLDEMMLGMGFLIGFSWEQCFHQAIDITTGILHEKDIPVEISTLVIGIIFFALIYPLWRDFIIPMQTENGYRLGYIPRWVRNRIKFVPEATQIEWLETNILGITADLTMEQRWRLAQKLQEYQPPQQPPPYRTSQQPLHPPPYESPQQPPPFPLPPVQAAPSAAPAATPAAAPPPPPVATSSDVP